MRAVIEIGYVVMAVWLIVAAVIRLGLQLGHGYTLDPIPFLSIAIALVALTFLAAMRRREQKRQR